MIAPIERVTLKDGNPRHHIVEEEQFEILKMVSNMANLANSSLLFAAICWCCSKRVA